MTSAFYANGATSPGGLASGRYATDAEIAAKRTGAEAMKEEADQ